VKYKNSNFLIVLPLVISFSVLAGIYIEKFIGASNSSGSVEFSSPSKHSKVEAVLQYIEHGYVDSVDSDDIEEKVIPMIFDQLDPHSSYIAASEFDDMNDPLVGSFEGIGVQFNIKKDTVVIVQVISGGPSERVGLLAGDRVVTVDDSTIAGIGIKSKGVVRLLKGPKNTKVKVGVKRNGNKNLIYFEITRDKIPFYSIDASFMLTKDVGYIKLARFAETSYDEFRKHASGLLAEGMRKLVFDLRGNGGGVMMASILIANEFLDADKLIVYTDGNAYDKKVYKSNSDGICKQTELVVLIDAYTASASEILSGAMQDNDRATIIGRRSFGKGLVMDQRQFPDGSAVRLTVARYYTPTGRCIQKPYDEGRDKYFQEIHERFSTGEFIHADSISFPDSLKYTTPAGRVVYGGGGIMPDLFVPVDTSWYSDFLLEVTSKGLIYEFCWSYSDKNRDVLSNLNNVEDLHAYLNKADVYSEFITYCVNKKVKSEPLASGNSVVETENRLHAYVVRNILGDSEFYQVLSENDKAVKRAVECLKNGKGCAKRE